MKLANVAVVVMFNVLKLCDSFNSDDQNSTFSIEGVSDVELMAKLTLMRDHVIIDPVKEVDEKIMVNLMDHLYLNQLRRHTPGGRLILPALGRRDVGCDTSSKKQDHRISALCNVVTAKCLSAEHVMNIFPPKPVTLAQSLAYTCPLLLFRLDRPLCTHDELLQLRRSERKIKLVEPSTERVWGFSILFVTLSIVVSMGGLIVLPFVRRDARRTILTLFEGLAVGGLLGSAIIHLFPKAYNIDQERFQQYFSRIFVVFGGVYMFYIFERILKILTAYRNAKLKKPSPRRRTMSNRDEHFMMNMSTFNTRSVPSNPMISNIIADATAKKPNERSSSIQSAQSNSTKNQIDKCLASIRKATSQPSLNQRIVQPQSFGKGSLNHLSDAKTPSVISKQSYVADIAGRREDHDTAVNRLHTDSVTWMIVLGDASLNFIDGLSIGAAFDRNILAGISISIAIMLEEVPHRLGTFAVLIRAGLDMKQSFLRIFISACFLYPGLVMGVFLGDEADDASPYIFALAGGMFLYMALVDVMKEMNNSMEKALRNSFRSGFKILALQNLGIILAIFILSVLALYEQDMDFEQVELQELTGNALV